MQLQEVTQAKAHVEWRLALKLEGLAKNYEDQRFRIQFQGRDKMTNGPGWLSKWTSPLGRSSLR